MRLPDWLRRALSFIDEALASESPLSLASEVD